MSQVTGEYVLPERATRREWVGLAVLTLAALVYAMDLTVLKVAAAQVAFLDAIHFVAAVATVGAVVTSIGAAVALRGVPARPEPAVEMDTAPTGATG